MFDHHHMPAIAMIKIKSNVVDSNLRSALPTLESLRSSKLSPSVRSETPPYVDHTPTLNIARTNAK